LRSWSVDGLVAAGVVGVAGVWAIAATGIQTKSAKISTATRQEAILVPSLENTDDQCFT
jgi:hypothetical protein